MASYKASASDFDNWDKEFTPTAQHFDEWDKEDEKKPIDLNKLSSDHPILYKLAEKLAQHPKINSALEGVADSPVVEAGLSAAPALANAFGNVLNLPTELTTGQKLVPRMERPFEEPQDLTGKIGSKIGEVLGAGTAFAAAPGSMTLPGGLATGFAQGEGGIVPRTMDALLGTLLPGLVHGGKFLKNVKQSKSTAKEIRGLQLDKADADKGVFGAKEALANKLNKDIAEVSPNTEALKKSLENAAGKSESRAKENVAQLTQKAEKDISKKFNNLYENFNAGKGGQSFVKEPVQIENLSKEYGLKPEDFSNDSKKLIEELVGKEVTNPGDETISVITGKPLKQASSSMEQAKPAKVADYINLWKQLRSEVAEYRHSGKMAQTPEAKRTFRDKANQLEKLSDDINSKAMGSLSKDQSKEYAAIQKGYLNERIPFLEKNVLKSATDKFGEIPDNYFDKLNKSGVPELIKTFQKEHPELVHAISQHDLRGASKLSTSALKDLIDGDFGKFIPKNMKDMVKGLHLHKSAQELLTKALTKVPSSEISRKVRTGDINEIIKHRPDLAAPFENVAKEQERLRSIKNALVEKGFKLKEIESQLSKYKKTYSLAKFAGTPLGVYAGIVKSKAGSSNDSDN